MPLDVEKDFGFGRDQRTFAKAGQSADAAMPKFDDSGWAEVHRAARLGGRACRSQQGPAAKKSDRGAAHGFKAIGRDFPENSIGWYRTPIAITAADRGRRIWLEFDGVFRDCHRVRERLCRRPERERLRTVQRPNRRFPRL